MTKEDLVAEIAGETGFNKTDCGVMVAAMTKIIKETVNRGDTVAIRGLFTLGTVVRKARNGRNLHTGEIVPIPERKLPHCKFHFDIQPCATEQ